MDTTIRNIDERVYRALKARAAADGKTIGEAINEAIREYLTRPGLLPKSGSLRDLTPVSWAEGNERSSEEIDVILFNARP